MKIVIDGMGGDNAPQATVEGAVLASKEYGVNIVITGKQDIIDAELKKYDYDKNKIEVVNTSEIVENEDKPTLAIRRKKDSSMVVGLNLVKSKEADAIISAGNTGALLTGAVLIIKRIKGIDRPCLCPTFPSVKGEFVLVADAGANADCKPLNLLDFALLTDVYAKKVLKRNNPKIAIANIGSEEGKGNDLVKKSFELLKSQEDINFIGNMETRDVMNNVCDIIVCDGFTGNIILKTSEGVAMSILGMLKDVMMSSTKSKIGALLMKDKLKELKNFADYSNYGGAPFLGVNGGVIKAHGSSNAIAFKNAIRQAIEFSKANVVEEIETRLEKRVAVEK